MFNGIILGCYLDKTCTANWKRGLSRRKNIFLGHCVLLFYPVMGRGKTVEATRKDLKAMNFTGCFGKDTASHFLKKA